MGLNLQSEHSLVTNLVNFLVDILDACSELCIEVGIPPKDKVWRTVRSLPKILPLLGPTISIILLIFMFHATTPGLYFAFYQDGCALLFSMQFNKSE